MISALRKLGKKNEEGQRKPAMPSGVSSMGQSLQRKFGRGVHYNMKIVIKGDRNTGKSTLLKRFQGNAFKEEYIPTNEIQVCSINWSYRVADDVVKVEVWDVVDKGKRKKSDSLKLANDMSPSEKQVSGVLDAQFLDVYKGTHGCIMLLDITKQWTFKYVERELPKVPQNMPVLVLCNFLDMQEHRVVQKDEIQSFVKYIDRGENGAIVLFAECCLKNGFGLKYIHKFFNIPFLKLQQETLEKQLETNKEDMEATLEELSFHRSTEEQDYEKFLAYMEKKAIDKKTPRSPPKTSNIGNNSKSSPLSPPKASDTTSKTSTVTASKPEPSKKSVGQPKSIDDFVPDETIDSGFLGETEKREDKKNASSEDSSEDSESEKVSNPMVSGFQDISSDEDNVQTTPAPLQKPNTSFDVDIELTSEESEQEDATGLSPVTPVTQDSSGDEKVTESSPNIQKTHEISPPFEKTNEISPPLGKANYDIVLNDEDNNFMDAWLDSASTDPREISVKSGKKVEKKASDNFEDLDMFAASQLASKTVPNTSATVEENSSSDVEEEKKKRHSSKKQKEGEEGKSRHRSKHKHKKKSKTKDSNNVESGEKKHKSKKKHRETNRERVQSTGAEYESF